MAHSDSAAGNDVPQASLSFCELIDLPKVADHRGNLTFIEQHRNVPFGIERVYYLYDIPGGAERGGHAHRQLQQMIVAISGSFDVILKDGRETKRIHMNRPYYGLYICPMVWRQLDNFSSGSVCMVVASHLYSEDDYIRDFSRFTQSVPATNKDE